MDDKFRQDYLAVFDRMKETEEELKRSPLCRFIRLENIVEVKEAEKNAKNEENDHA